MLQLCCFMGAVAWFRGAFELVKISAAEGQWIASLSDFVRTVHQQWIWVNVCYN